MIARFLSESIVLQKNSSLKHYFDENFDKKSFFGGSFYRQDNGLSWNLTDNKPGEWFVSDGLLWISYSQKFNYDTTNNILVLDIDPDSRSVRLRHDFVFLNQISLKDEEKQKISAAYVRKVMRKLKDKTSLDFLEKCSKKRHDWTKNDLKGI